VPAGEMVPVRINGAMVYDLSGFVESDSALVQANKEKMEGHD
jgi:hypothetical protein